MQADTVRRWRRQGMWHHLKWRRERRRPGRPPIPAEIRKLIREMSQDNHLWGAPRIYGELLKLGIKVSRTTVAKYMDRRPETPSPTWRTFWRLHAPDLPVGSVCADLSSRLRAVSTWVLQIIPTFCYWLWGLVSSWWCWSLRGYVRPATESPVFDEAAVARPLEMVKLIQAFGRSPPDHQSSLVDPPVHLYPPIEVESADVRLVSSVRNSCNVSPQIVLTLRSVNDVQKSDGVQQAAA